jgi:hypothetical protein
VYSVRGFVEANAPAGSKGKAQHAAAKKERIRRPASEDRMGTHIRGRVSGTAIMLIVRFVLSDRKIKARL